MVDLKNMSKKKKAEYIWEYYKIHIIGILVIIFIVGSLIHSQITKVDYIFNLTMIGDMVDENRRIDLEKQLTSIVIKDGEKRKQAIVDIIPSGTEAKKSNQYMQNMQKFIANISVGELDVVILIKVCLSL